MSRKIINDGAHRHSRESKTISVSNDGMRLVARHLSICPNRPEITPETNMPLQFVVEKDGSASVICGFCNKNLGRCKVLETE